ncbi:MAG: ECF transporter S component [Erysipelotrichales bacterium]|nr:ECF transporter S component [Erysipelotrichales bacterium]
MNHNQIKNLTLTGLGMAIVFIGTMIIIPNSTGGYFNLGDGFIMLFASIVHPFEAFLIGGVASCMVDAVSGYTPYIIPTLVTKGLEAISISYIMNKYRSNSKIKYFAYLVGACLMVIGYFLFEIYLNQSIGIAVIALPGNIFQSLVGYVIAVILEPTIYRLAHKFQKDY